MAELNQTNPLLRVCVDRFDNRAAQGRLYSCALAEPASFDDLSSLVLQLDRMFDRQNLPQAFRRQRTILREGDWTQCVPVDPSGAMDEEQVNEQLGEIATFEILVVSRRNSSWQGMIDWLDGSERTPFFGHLELLHLIGGRLSGK